MLAETLGVVRFGPFELDLEREELKRHGEAVNIQPQPLRALALLVAQGGRMMNRDELQKLLWGESPYLDVDRSLNHTIRKLRLVLDDDARNPTFIQTVPRRGYRFIGRVETQLARPATPVDSTLTVVSTELSPAVLEAGKGPVRLRLMRFRDIVDNGRFPPMAEGLSEELISVLVRLRRRGLEVLDPDGAEPATGAVAASAATPAGEPASRDLLLRGAVCTTGLSARVHARLVRKVDECVVGTVVLEEKLGDLFALQRTLAEQIVAALVEPLLGEERRSQDSHD